MMKPHEAAENILGRIHWTVMQQFSPQQKDAVRDAIIEALSSFDLQFTAPEELLGLALAERDGRARIFCLGKEAPPLSGNAIIRDGYISDARALIARMNELKAQAK